MSESKPLATHDYSSGDLAAALEFLKGTRSGLRTLRKVRVWKDRFQVIDINRDSFEITGIGYADADIVPILQAVNTAFDPKSIHEPFAGEYKEFDTGRRYTWALDRVM
jgi:hypothetical protein